MLFENVLIVDPVDGEFTGSVECENGLITNVKKRSCTWKYILMPGFADTHTHGLKGIDAMSALPADFERWADFALEDGVTYLFPTTVSSDFKMLEKVIKNFSKANCPSLAGLHLEGPFINKEKAGAQNPEYICGFNHNLPDLVKDYVKIITAAPEISGFRELVKFAKKYNIKISIGHSNATFSEMKLAFEMGIDRITHFPNALRGIHHRELGGTGAGLFFDFKVEMICDGIHTSPDFVKFVYKIKGAENIILVTDSIVATGLNNGKYNLGGLEVTVKDGMAKLKTGTLAGSVLRFLDGVRNFYKYTKCSLKELSKVSSYNALVNLGIKNAGRIKEGFLARFVLLNENLEIVDTVL
ncbi:N-acetylglucosamine-6-phosphate deacetylase [Thermosipho ferrireducens]|uniref:N-acetylglucosamine-6-phosphate deacetylase n=1 Tax=Thermosipho ferrireducens TaxID=2571116 RepID=A0ABX7S989_9BACT|nr:N-acetylglucosamine-6-phosphate deacetylase [Thermosipho ferrireducens]QTA38528.1 N-acetylglucosamine-6-phosphate deacetylase [Thermosipho ferrireducens]